MTTVSQPAGVASAFQHNAKESSVLRSAPEHNARGASGQRLRAPGVIKGINDSRSVFGCTELVRPCDRFFPAAPVAIHVCRGRERVATFANIDHVGPVSAAAQQQISSDDSGFHTVPFFCSDCTRIAQPLFPANIAPAPGYFLTCVSSITELVRTRGHLPSPRCLAPLSGIPSGGAF
jgi:hypothetical protein